MLIIDNREGKLIELIKATSGFIIPYELKSLQVGDIIISNDSHPDKSIIIERKCIADMLASIKDGRYKEQKIRLQAEVSQNPNNTIICYLVEGTVQEVRYPNEKKVFHGSLVSSIFRDKIPLIRTTSLNETLEMIIRIHERMSKDITDFFRPNHTPTPTATTIPTNIPVEQQETQLDIQTGSQGVQPLELQINIQNGTDNTYLNTIKKCKKENLNPKIWNQICLTNIPGVSTNIAIKITETFPSIKNLLAEYGKCETDEKRILLISEICLVDNGKTKRRIGEVVSKRIMEYLYEEPSL
uniref:ERCC4 domain-containing protein n=1 Tax=viral metagenome TaxID=1070528 RepID=A0A6C0EYE7_9ZZZZ